MRVLWAQRACAACRQHGPTRSAPWQAPGDKRTVAGRGGAEERGGSEERDDEHHVVHEGRRCVPVANPSTTHCTDTYIFSPNRKTSRTTKGDGEERRGARGRGPPHARCPGGAHRWSSESERGAAPTEHPTRHRARASATSCMAEGLGHGSFLVHCPYIAARGYFVPT